MSATGSTIPGVTMNITEIVKGNLTGMGHNSDVMLLATRHNPPKNCGPEYCRCSVLEVSPHLPDGYYEVTFCGHSAFLQHASGSWSIGIPWVDIPAARARPHDVTAMEWIQEIAE